MAENKREETSKKSDETAANDATDQSWQDTIDDGSADAGDIDIDAVVGDDSDADPIEILTAERDELKDQLLRALADTENMRRRTEREVASARKYGHTNFARDLVGAIDNLDRAMQAAAPKDDADQNETLTALMTGIELSWNEIQSVIEKHGINRVNPVGEKFDYNLHQAMFEVPTNEVEPGMVVEVVQHGYVLHDRLLRPAMVGVSKAVVADES